MKRGFTLIELLIVIAIIAILALIAIPNFLEAQTRAKVARVEADMRSMSTAIESYYVDYNGYPLAPQSRNHNAGYFKVFSGSLHKFRCLSTPIAYVTDAAFGDPFRSTEDKIWSRSIGFVNVAGSVQHLQSVGPTGTSNPWTTAGTPPAPDEVALPGMLKFNGHKDTRVFPTMWILVNTGPDRAYGDHDLIQNGNKINTMNIMRRRFDWNRHTIRGAAPTYDPTNGTISEGNILRLSAGTIE